MWWSLEFLADSTILIYLQSNVYQQEDKKKNQPANTACAASIITQITWIDNWTAQSFGEFFIIG